MIRIIEVGPRDGLQNEKTPIPLELKLAFVRDLRAAGIGEIEVTSFVSPKWVPQLADAEELCRAIPDLEGVSALVPNEAGLERALGVGLRRFALFLAVSETFSQKNTHRSVAESLEQSARVLERIRAEVPGAWVRIYVSTIFACPYEGPIDPEAAGSLARRCLRMGADEVSLGDTIGAGGPKHVSALARALKDAPKDQIAWHFHDTWGLAVANVARALELGFTAFDASAGGLGGCPYAPGATGNLATEDLMALLERWGECPPVDLARLAAASLPVLRHLGREPGSKAQRAALAPVASSPR